MSSEPTRAPRREGSPPLPPAAALWVAVLAISTGAIFARRAGEAHATVIAFWRCALATLVLLPFALRRLGPELRALDTRDRLVALAAGVALGLHFQTWIASLSYTTIASSTVIVCTTPVWVAALSPWLSRDELPHGALFALSVCAVGSICIGWGDFSLGGRALFGDALALAGAIFAALYLLAGRHLRRHVSLPTYLASIYGLAGAWLLAASLLGGHALTGYSRATGLAILGLAVFPQLVGHSTFNWALRWTSARLVAAVALLEPVLASIWGVIFEAEVPGATTWLGGAVLLAGIYLAARAESVEPAPAHETM